MISLENISGTAGGRCGVGGLMDGLMRRSLLLTVSCLFVFVNAYSQRLIENPAVGIDSSSETTMMPITAVIMGMGDRNLTLVTINYTTTLFQAWVAIASDTYVTTDGSTSKLQILEWGVIMKDQDEEFVTLNFNERYSVQSNTTYEFFMLFPEIPENATVLNIQEPVTNGLFWIGINLNNQSEVVAPVAPVAPNYRTVLFLFVICGVTFIFVLWVIFYIKKKHTSAYPDENIFSADPYPIDKKLKNEDSTEIKLQDKHYSEHEVHGHPETIPENFAHKEETKPTETQYLPEVTYTPTKQTIPDASKKSGMLRETKKPIESIIISKPNEEQTDELQILYAPNNYFLQNDLYMYPVVKMPTNNCKLKLPRLGRSNQKGYKEDDFFNKIKSQITDFSIVNNVHMVIPNYNKPYEPDIVLFDKKLNLYIDIEIDEPYEGYYRYPTHYIDKDTIRDLFFTESGWIVIRFTEKQIHLEYNECIDYIYNVVNSLRNLDFTTQPKCEIESQWDENQSIQWQKINYRENYLGIERFNKRTKNKEIIIDLNENESIEKIIQRTNRFYFENTSTDVAFDEETHKYIHPKDNTGNAEYISVTTLIDRFFPFDVRRYVERKAVEENRTEDEVLAEYERKRDEAAEKGTLLHNQIDSFFKCKDFKSNSKEFNLFLKFFNDEIKTRNIEFIDAEKKILYDEHNIAGTIDCLFKNKDTGNYIILDWKRSTKLIIDGNPILYGYGFALSELKHLDNSSYYKYCLQQNFYKYILEKKYNMKISSMKLIVLHEIYENYHLIPVKNMENEVKIILNSLKHKI